MSHQTASFDGQYGGFIRQAQLIPAIVPISAATLWRWVKAGNFPKPVKLGGNTTAWKQGDVRAWLDAQGGGGGGGKATKGNALATLKAGC